MKKIVIFILILILQNLFSENKWTILGYFDGDQYLGDCGVTTVISLLTGMDSVTNVNTVIQADRYDSPYNLGTWSDTRRFKIEHVDFEENDYNFNQVCVDSTLGELDMGAMETLRNFLVWGVTNYPSERYILILKNHGGGWKRGICADETNGGILEIKEIRSALDELFAQTGVKIDILAFDACLMGMIEVAYELKDFITTSFIFSQDFGYTPQNFKTQDIIRGLDDDPEISSINAANLFIENVGSAITLSAINVSGLSELTYCISSFVDSFIQYPEWNSVLTAFNSSTTFGYRDSFVDMRLFFESLVNSEIIGAAEVVEKLDASIIANITRNPANPATGLNIFFNHFFDGDIISYNNIFSAFAEDSEWKEFLTEYSNSYDTFNQFVWNSYENLRGYWTVIDNDGDYKSWQYRDWEVYIGTTGKLCDDYIVSPKINIGSKSIFKFKAKSLNGDKFEVKLSETGNEDANDFDVILLNVTYPVSDWTEYSVELNSFFDQDIYIALQCVSSSGTELAIKDIELSPVNEISDDNVVSTNILFQNYPNPFNPATTIRYVLATKQHVNVSVFNISGGKVADLVNEIKEAGNHTVKFDAKNLPSGEYIYTIESKEYHAAKKMILLK